MRKKLLSILALLCLTASSAWAGVIESGTNGNITWSLDDDGVLSISGSGEVPEGMFPYDWSNGTKVKKIIFAAVASTASLCGPCVRTECILSHRETNSPCRNHI